MSLVFVTHEQRPDLAESEELRREWPEFMLHDDTARGRWGRLYDRYTASSSGGSTRRPTPSS